MAHTTIKTIKSDEKIGGLPIILRPKNLVAGLQPEYLVDHFPATIGRHPVNDVELPFDSVSRYHARLEMRAGRLHLVDLRSSNGTFVNGKRVQIAPIMDSDAVTFGSIDFSVTLPGKMDEAPERSLTPYSDITRSSVHFVTQERPAQTVYHTELPDDTGHAAMIQDEITDPLALKKAKQRLISLYRLQDVLRSATEEERLLQGVLSLLFDVLPVDRGVILTRDEKDIGVFRPIAIKIKTELARERIGISKTILQRCLKEKVAVLTRGRHCRSAF